MAKNKKNKKNRNKKNQLLKNVSATELFEQGKALHDAGKQRDAIAALKMAAKKGWPRDQIEGLLFKAYSSRAIQLREKGMEAEATEVNEHACALMPSYQCLTDEELFSFLKTTGIQKAVSAYAEFLDANKPSAKIEQYLGERFLISQQWDLLGVFDDQIPLMKDISPVMDAINLMNTGDWESALENLRPVSRSSPWATLRKFCHAMVCFYKEDDAGMQRALNMIPDNSLLKPLSCKLAQDIHAVSCLWEGPVHLEHQVAALFDEIRQNRFKKAGEYIKKIARTLSPIETDLAIFHILELLWMTVSKSHVHGYFDLIDKLLPETLVEILDAKMGCLMVSPIPFTKAAEYIPLLEIEFPDKKDRTIATAFVLLEIIKNYQMSSSGGPFIEDNGIDLIEFLDLTSENLEELIPELLVYAISQDSGNRQIYEFLANLPTTNRSAYKWIEEGLTIMRDHFSDDPYPCMELAKLYYRKNAYRKAENILNEAMTRAPHDICVVNMHVMSLLISSDKNITRGKLHLARQDIVKAEELGSPDTRFLVTEKQILLQIAEQGQLSLFKNTTVSEHGDVRRILDEFTHRLTPFECLRSLGALFIDVNHSTKKDIWDKKMIRVVDQAIRKRLKSVNALTQSEHNSLLMPLSLELPVIPGNDLAGLFILRAKGLLCKIDDRYIISVFDNLARSRHFKPVLQEIRRRRKKADENFTAMLSFYEVTLKHLNGDLLNDELSFLNVIDKVSASDIEPLRAAARRLSMYAAGNIVLKKALEDFNFQLLAPLPFMDEYDDDDDDDDEYDDDDDIFDDEFDHEISVAMNEKFIEDLENFIVEMGIKGASVKKVLAFKNSVHISPISEAISAIAASMDKEMLDLMSRELRLVIFGKA